MTSGVTVRRARPSDAPRMAQVHVTSWQQTYRGLMPDSVLDDPNLLPARERFWTGALTDERWSTNRTVVAEVNGTIVGIAMSGPSQEPDVTEESQLHLIYLDAAHHGCGVGAALLNAVLDPDESAALWVVDPNPRAQAFYRKHRFAPDGRSRTEDGVREIRWVRPAGTS
ncbi:GNAT family N-acetyltransferase [Kineococcus sp. NPDC059986]|uniref:GNAT family N-acetyltransferase n=1 Tax=Kineococcus sp. NPDC059986 TaxID=3155538 RepID=UPI00344DA675